MQAGVFSIHFIFRDENHAIKTLGDPTVIAAMRDLYAAKSNTARRVAPERSTRRDWNAAGTGRGCQLGSDGPTKRKRDYCDNLNEA